jgi:hypothetical protein
MPAWPASVRFGRPVKKKSTEVIMLRRKPQHDFGR